MMWVVELIQLKVVLLKTELGESRVVMSPSDAQELGAAFESRVKISSLDGRGAIALVSISESEEFIKKGEIGLFQEVAKFLGVKEGSIVQVELAKPSRSSATIKKKTFGAKLSKDEIYSLVRDIYEGVVSKVELAAFVTALQFHGADMDEIEYLTRAMAEVGTMLDFGDALIVDKHGIGGVPGASKDALLIVPIVAAAGLMIPKTSTRAILSPSGTVDTMEVLAPIDLSSDEIIEITRRIGGVITWTRSANLSPVDAILIERVEHPLSIDPESLIYASIMSRKYAAGVKRLVLDIPTGPESKVETMKDARRIARNMITLGDRLGIRVEAAISYGGQPIGEFIGPALEAREALTTLITGGKGVGSLVEKAVALAGILLELGGIAPIGEGSNLARDILTSKKAYDKMRQIIEAQGGNPDIKPEDIEVGSYREVVRAPMKGYVTAVSNRAITRIARAAGAPKDKGAGVRVFGKRGDRVEPGDPLLEIYSSSESRLQAALELTRGLEPVKVEGMILEIHREHLIRF